MKYFLIFIGVGEEIKIWLESWHNILDCEYGWHNFCCCLLGSKYDNRWVRFQNQWSCGNQTMALEHRQQGHSLLRELFSLDQRSLQQSITPYWVIYHITFPDLLAPFSVFRHLCMVDTHTYSKNVAILQDIVGHLIIE